MSDDIQVPNDENSSEESPKSNKCEDSGYPIQRDHNKDDEHIVGEIMKITSNRDKLEKELILYGNPHYIKYPTKIGKVYSFAYHKDTPLVVISTRCKHC